MILFENFSQFKSCLQKVTIEQNHLRTGQIDYLLEEKLMRVRLVMQDKIGVDYFHVAVKNII